MPRCSACQYLYSRYAKGGRRCFAWQSATSMCAHVNCKDVAIVPIVCILELLLLLLLLSSSSSSLCSLYVFNTVMIPAYTENRLYALFFIVYVGIGEWC